MKMETNLTIQNPSNSENMCYYFCFRLDSASADSVHREELAVFLGLWTASGYTDQPYFISLHQVSICTPTVGIKLKFRLVSVVLNQNCTPY